MFYIQLIYYIYVYIYMCIYTDIRLYNMNENDFEFAVYYYKIASLVSCSSTGTVARYYEIFYWMSQSGRFSCRSHDHTLLLLFVYYLLYYGRNISGRTYMRHFEFEIAVKMTIWRYILSTYANKIILIRVYTYTPVHIHLLLKLYTFSLYIMYTSTYIM